VAIAVFLAFVLTATAHSAPLAGFWDDAKPALVDISQWLQRLIPAAPDSRTLGVPSFGGQVTIGGLWTTSNDPAPEIDRDAGDKRDLYWRATTYDAFTLTGWTTTTPQTEDRPAGEDLLAGTLDAIPATSVRAPSTFRVIPQSSLFHVVFSPTDPLSVDRDTTLHLSGADGFVQSIEVDGRVHRPGVHPDRGRRPRRVTQNRLRAAHRATRRASPPATRDPEGRMGPAATQLFNDIMATVKAGPTHTAVRHRWRRSSRSSALSPFHYETDVPRVCDQYSASLSASRPRSVGFCEHYATTMAIPSGRPASGPARRGGSCPATRSGNGQGADPDRRRPCLGRGCTSRAAGRCSTRPVPASRTPTLRQKVVPIASATPVHVRPLERRPRGTTQPPEPASARSGPASTSGGSNRPA
jgi:hypothetical protein